VPLSNDRVIQLLNRYFVPVYLSNEDFREGGDAPAAERETLSRIHREGHDKGLSVGSVHAYVLSPEGRLLDSLHVGDAFKVERLVAMLDKTVAQQRPSGGNPVVQPSPQWPAPAADPDDLVIHVTARYLEKQGDEYTLVRDAGGNWSASPGEDWLVLSPTAWRGLLPGQALNAGTRWDVRGEALTAILNRFYPPTENNDLDTNRMDAQVLQAEVVGVRQGVARVRLSGRYRMKHPFYHKEDNRFVEGDLHGWMSVRSRDRRIESLRLVTDQAFYRDGTSPGQPFGAVARTVPRAETASGK
jgi:hypothetical protein